ncbi:MAG: hypothetical protein H8E44_36935 [Planctomycetes bacterium]|nr:hypothetical protein [Planctomycetota bacterium]MBL7038585.1 hypothetical protein [Pirellulaceae bacterium]
MNRKPRVLSLSGTIAVVHFSLFLLIVGYQRSFASPDGMVHWTDENRPILEFLETAMFVHMFPVGWLSFLTDWLHWTESDVIVMVILAAANSALVGYILAWILSLACRKLFPRLVGDSLRHPTTHARTDAASMPDTPSV